MRKPRPIDALFSQTRQQVLAATLMHPERWWYLSELANHLGRTPSTLQRELDRLSGADILRTRKEANRLYYQPNPQCPFLAELTGLFTKTAGLRDILAATLEEFQKKVSWAFIFGSIARSEELSASDIDVLVIGKLTLSELATPLRRAEEKLGREINPALYSEKEFAEHVESGQHFARTVLASEKLFLLGDSDEFATTFKTGKAKGPSDK